MNIIETIRREVERINEDIVSNNIDCHPTTVLDDLLSFLDTLEEKSEKPINLEGFSKEFDEYFLPKNREQKGRWGFADIFSLARHFYELGETRMKEQDTRDMYMSDNRHFQKVYELGKKDMKEQMMKDAVEGTIINDKGYPTELVLNTYLSKYNDRDNVKLIIIKEDAK